MSKVTDVIRNKAFYENRRITLAAAAFDYSLKTSESMFRSEGQHGSASSGFTEGLRNNIRIRATTSAVWVKYNAVGSDAIHIAADSDHCEFNVEVSDIFLRSAVETTAQVQDVDTVLDVSGSLNSTYFYIDTINATSGATVRYGIWFDVDSGGTEPTDTTVDTWVETDISEDDSANTVATAARSSIGALGAFSTGGATNAVAVTHAVSGPVPGSSDSSAAATGFTFDAAGTAGVGTATIVQIKAI